MLYLYRKSYKEYTIKNYFLFGERHSGTKFLEKIIKSSFNLKHNKKYGHKHFFGFQNKHDLLRDKETLFLGITRDPYQWIAALNNEPHHVPNQLKPVLSHLNDEWYSIDQYYALHDIRSYRMSKSSEIIDDYNFITGGRYSSIFECRITKLNYLVNTLPNLLNNYILISYESLILNTNLLISLICNTFNIESKNNNYIPYVKKPNIRNIEQDIKNLISCNLNWTLENQMGYNRDILF